MKETKNDTFESKSPWFECMGFLSDSHENIFKNATILASGLFRRIRWADPRVVYSDQSSY